ncbi:flagellar assembly protein FliW [Cohnella panacarvi]|uniref:flagellar assembly protein FliW n=1 Tax=Cohnella panacarvi TaxID=400776 RepID=UPI0004786A65|nr:flagellar assembly protein FliW [Cohnella panacarvi]
MIIHTSRFGELDIQEQEVIRFEQGIPGFEDLRRFVLIEVPDHEPFSYLQCIDDSEVSFIVTDPFEFFADFECELPVPVVEDLKIVSAEQVLVRAIVSIHGELESATANLVAPVIINRAERTGKQVVLAKTSYATRHALFQPSESESK